MNQPDPDPTSTPAQVAASSANEPPLPEAAPFATPAAPMADPAAPVDVAPWVSPAAPAGDPAFPANAHPSTNPADAATWADPASAADGHQPAGEVPTDGGAVAAQRRRSLVRLVVAVLALGALAGSAFVVGFGTGFAVGRPDKSSFEIRVFLEHDATESEKAAVRVALERLEPTGEVRLKSREEAMADARENLRDYPEILETMTADKLPETFEATIIRRKPTCAGITSIWNLGGVDQLFVVRPPVGDQPGVKLGC